MSPLLKKQAEDEEYFKEFKKVSSEKKEENNWQRTEKREENREQFKNERIFGRDDANK